MLVESLCVLSLPVATLLLLMDTLKRDAHTIIADEFNVTHLSNQQVISLIQQRVDVPQKL